MTTSTARLLGALADVGPDPARGGYTRPVFSAAELDLRRWFRQEADRRGLDVEVDQNGAIWAWQDLPSGNRSDAVVTGSHLDSVPSVGPFDGPLGVVSALVAVDLLRERGHQARRPLAVVVFPEEEGSRFGLACLGSGLMTGTVDPARALALRDDNGNTLADAARAHSLAPERMGVDPTRLRAIGAFVELHVEQGRGLVHLGQPVGIGTSIVGHGRWRVSITGQGNHAGTTAMTDRRDPMTAAAATILAAQSAALQVPEARATVGKLVPTPGGSNVIASSVDLWLDVRHTDDVVVRDLVATIEARASELAEAAGCSAILHEESYSPTAHLDGGLRERIEKALPQAPLLPTGAGHDAGALAAYVPTAMLFVRNPTGVSHSPEEHAEDDDLEAGAQALATVLADLTTAQGPERSIR